jgi:hypothetical protein
MKIEPVWLRWRKKGSFAERVYVGYVVAVGVAALLVVISLTVYVMLRF